MNTAGALQILLCAIAGYSFGNVLYNQLRTAHNKRHAVYASVVFALIVAELGNLFLR